MIDPLKNLKNAMDQTVFKEMKFSERQKRNALAQVDEHDQSQINILILKALKHHTKSGYSLFKELQQTDAKVTLTEQEGLLYIYLHKLEQQQLISSTWEKSNDGEVKTYFIEKKGLKTLATYDKKMSKDKLNSFVLDIEGGLRLMDQQYSSKLIDEYLDKVKGQIKSKEAQHVVVQELHAHIQHRKLEYLEKGLPDAEAVQQVINHIGNPITLGREMHRIHKPKIDWPLICLFSLLLVFGIVPMYTMNVEYLGNAFINKTFYSIISLCIVVGLMFFDYRKIKQLWPWLFSIALIICMLMGYSHYLVKGQMYLAIGVININQWFISLLFVLGLAGFMSVQTSEKKKILISFVMVWLPLYFFLLAGSIPLSIFYLFTAFFIFSISSLPKKIFRKIIMLNSVVLIILAPLFLLNLKAHQIARLTSFINPGEDSSGYGYIYLRVREYIDHATLLGNKNTIAPIPEMHTDLIFPYIVYNFGWLVSGCLIVCLALFLFRMLTISKETKDPLGRMLIIAGVTMIGLVAIWNIGMVVGILPIIGVPLPFISYGGQFLVIYAVYIGLILSVNRRKHLVQISKKGDLA